MYEYNKSCGEGDIQEALRTTKLYGEIFVDQQPWILRSNGPHMMLDCTELNLHWVTIYISNCTIGPRMQVLITLGHLVDQKLVLMK